MLKEYNVEINPVKSSWVYYRSQQSNLLYFSNYKCASTLYRNWFEKIGWEKLNLTTAEIDWNHSYVFSHIRDPMIKHRKAIVEFCQLQKIIDTITAELKNGNSRWLDILGSVTLADGHSRSIRSILGDQIPLKIDWIPIDVDFDHKKYTLDILEANGEKVSDQLRQELISAGKVNESTEDEKTLFDHLIKIPPTDLTLNYIDYDQCLYAIVCYSLERQ